MTAPLLSEKNLGTPKGHYRGITSVSWGSPSAGPGAINHSMQFNHGVAGGHEMNRFTGTEWGAHPLSHFGTEHPADIRLGWLNRVSSWKATARGQHKSGDILNAAADTVRVPPGNEE